jgi:serine protease Do
MENKQNSVVQVFADSGQFNWLEPYKSPQLNKVFGTGFFIDEKGYLVTSFHIVCGANSIQIQTPSFGKEQFDVKMVGACPYRDIALLRLSSESREKIKKTLGKIDFLKCGNSDEVRRSQKIITLGYPLGQESLKVTEGIVSGRQDVLGESFIQVTAPLNPGNSGGPSLNENGKVIGINTAIVPGAQNIGYIIPISGVMGIVDDLYKIKFLRNPILGCELNYGTVDMLSYLGNPKPGGLYISKVFKDTLFHKVGIQEGDMLYQVNKHDLDFYGDIKVSWSEDPITLSAFFNRLRVGEKISVVVYRRGEKKEANFSFDVLDPLPIRVMFPLLEPIEYEVFAGMVVMPLTINHMTLFGEINQFLLDYRKREMQKVPRLIVSTVFSNSQMHRARIVYAGDVLCEINGKEVFDLDDFRKAIMNNTKFVTIKTYSNKFAVLSMKKVIDEEEEFSRRYGYGETLLAKNLNQKLR